MLPAFVVRRPLFGTVVTSMPFLDSGGPCSRRRRSTTLLVEHLVAEAAAHGARAGGAAMRRTGSTSTRSRAEHKVNMTLPAAGDPDSLWRRLDKSVRNQIRKAERSGLTVENGGVESLTRVLRHVRRADARPRVAAARVPNSCAAVIDEFGAARARSCSCSKGGLPLSAGWSRSRSRIAWSCRGRSCLQGVLLALSEHAPLLGNAAARPASKGSARFDFGRSTRDSGTYRFKRQWGAQEEPLFWYRIPLGRARPQGHARDRWREGADRSPRRGSSLPLAVTRSVGPQIRRYLTQ